MGQVMRGTLFIECPAVQSMRTRHPALFSPADNTMQLLMWQRGSVGWHTTSWIELGAFLMLLMMHQPLVPSALAAG